MPKPCDPCSISELVIFGDSLSDTGNNALALRPNLTETPVPSCAFVGRFPYASGRYADGLIWPDFVAEQLNVRVAPAMAGGTNYACGGARLGPLRPDWLAPADFPPSLMTQVHAFLASRGGTAAADAVYIVAGGSNAARDALQAGVASAMRGVDPTFVIRQLAHACARDLQAILNRLRQAGAAHIVVWTIPDVSRLPAVRLFDGSAIGGRVVSVLNRTLRTRLAQEDVTWFDAHAVFQAMWANPSAFGFSNVTEPCASLPNCRPAEYLFWDAIHPTSAAHRVVADEILQAIVSTARAAVRLSA